MKVELGVGKGFRVVDEDDNDDATVALKGMGVKSKMFDNERSFFVRSVKSSRKKESQNSWIEESS